MIDIEKLQDEYAEYRKNSTDLEQAYQNCIDRQGSQLKAIQKEIDSYNDPKVNYLATWLADNIKEILESSEFKEK